MKDKKVEQMTSTDNNLTAKHRIGYAAGDAGGVMTLILIGYMTRYVTNVLEISFATMSIMLLIWNIWDMVNDPLVGTLMDKVFERTSSDREKFRPWILYSIPVIVIGLIAFFSVPGYLSGITQVAAVFLLKIVYEWGYTMMNIAMGSLLGAMALNDTERATLSSARGLGSSFAQLIAGVIIPQLLAALGENRQGYMIASIVTAVLGGILIFFHYAWTEERNKEIRELVIDDETDGDKVKFTDILVVFKENRAFFALSLHSIFFGVGVTLYSQFNPYMYADVLGNISLMAYTAIISQGLSIFLLSIAPALTKRVGGTVNVIKYCLFIGGVILAVLFAGMITMDLPAIVYLVVASIGFGLINMSVQLQWGLVSESIDYNEYLTGKRTEGAIYGTFSLTRRVGQTLSQSLAVLIIGWIGYNPELTNQGLRQAVSTDNWIMVMTLVAPAIAAAVSWLIFTYMWNIDDDLRQKIAAWRLGKVNGTIED